MPEDSTPAAPTTAAPATAADDAADKASDAANDAVNDTASEAGGAANSGADKATGAASHAAIEVDEANGVANETADDATNDSANNATNDGTNSVANEAVSGTEPTRRPIAVPKRVVFRVPGTAYIAVLFFVMCASSTALVSRWFTLIYVIPLGIAVWIMRTRTEVDADRIVVRRVLSRTTVPWSAVRSLRLSERGWVRAVRTDGGGEIALPTVRTRHLPALALISGGRIADPTVPPDQADQ